LRAGWCSRPSRLTLWRGCSVVRDAARGPRGGIGLRPAPRGHGGAASRILSGCSTIALQHCLAYPIRVQHLLFHHLYCSARSSAPSRPRTPSLVFCTSPYFCSNRHSLVYPITFSTGFCNSAVTYFFSNRHSSQCKAPRSLFDALAGTCDRVGRHQVQPPRRCVWRMHPAAIYQCTCGVGAES
jgi:hypothetical protein